MLNTTDTTAATDFTSIVHREIVSLLSEAKLPIPMITGTELLSRIGLNSLLLARLVIQLEMEFDFDPFEEHYVISDVRTVKDLVEAYVDTASKVNAAA